jgi:hypothetical protein
MCKEKPIIYVGEQSSTQLSRGQNIERHCLFISGMGGSHDRLGKIEYGLGKSYGGTKNVTIFNSIYSSDNPNPHRFYQIADSINYHLEKGNLDIVVHSLGATELYSALKMLKQKKEYFNNIDRNKKLHIVLLCPSGTSKGPLETVAYIKNIVRVATNELTNGPFSRSNTLERGIVSLNIFPAEIDNIAEKTRSSLPKSWSNKYEGVKSIQSKPEEVSKNAEEDALADIAKLDQKLDNAFYSENYDLARNLIRQRGELVKLEIGEIYSSKSKQNFKTKGLLRTILIGLANKPIKFIMKLAKKGVRVDWLVPEYDYPVPSKSAIRVYKKLNMKPQDHILIQEMETHIAGPIIHPESFGETIYSLRELISGQKSSSLNHIEFHS